MTDIRRVLVFPGGTEIGLEIERSIAKARGIEVVSAGSADDYLAPLVYRSHRQIPSVHHQGWLEALAAMVIDDQIDMIFPAHDDVVLALAEHADRIPATVVGSPAETCRVTRSKRATYALLRDVVRTPRTFDGFPDPTDFPVFVKPDRGQGSAGAFGVPDPLSLASRVQLSGLDEHRFLEVNVVTEYLPGVEYTVDCFSDRRRGLLFVGPRARLKARSGIAVHSTVVADDGEFASMARAIAARLEFHGAWFFQVKRTEDGALALLEVAARIAGTMGLQRARGVNLPLLSIFEADGVEVEICPAELPGEVGRMLQSRYRQRCSFERVYVDLDDTVLRPDGVDPDVVGLIFQCINAGIPVVCITRHQGPLEETLRRHRLAGLFDEVVHLTDGSSKADAIDPAGAIFIDDSFRERAEVARRLGIPTFDPSQIEVLRD